MIVVGIIVGGLVAFWAGVQESISVFVLSSFTYCVLLFYTACPCVEGVCI